jgi:hypothetical protein
MFGGQKCPWKTGIMEKWDLKEYRHSGTPSFYYSGI